MKKEKQPKYLMYRILRFIIKPIYWLLYCPRIINKKMIPKVEAVIICGNHYHAFDQFNVMFATKRVLHYMAKKEYFDGEHSLFGDPKKPSKFGIAVSKWLVHNAKMVIRTDRNANTEEAKKAALDVLKSGKALGLFPEGTRNKTEEFLLPFKFGAVSMAQKTGAYLVPFAITGEYKARLFRKRNLSIRFGEAFKVPKDMDLEKANEKLYNIVSKLKKEGLEEINGK